MVWKMQKMQISRTLWIFYHVLSFFGRMGAGCMVWKMQKMQISRNLFIFNHVFIFLTTLRGPSRCWTKSLENAKNANFSNPYHFCIIYLSCFYHFLSFFIFWTTLRGWVLDVWSGKCKKCKFLEPLSCFYHVFIMYLSLFYHFYHFFIFLTTLRGLVLAGRMVWKMQKMQISRTLIMFLSFIYLLFYHFVSFFHLFDNFEGIGAGRMVWKMQNANFSNPYHFLSVFIRRMVWKMQKMQISRTLFIFYHVFIILLIMFLSVFIMFYHFLSFGF